MQLLQFFRFIKKCKKGLSFSPTPLYAEPDTLFFTHASNAHKKTLQKICVMKYERIASHASACAISCVIGYRARQPNARARWCVRCDALIFHDTYFLQCVFLCAGCVREKEGIRFRNRGVGGEDWAILNCFVNRKNCNNLISSSSKILGWPRIYYIFKYVILMKTCARLYI